MAFAEPRRFGKSRTWHALRGFMERNTQFGKERIAASRATHSLDSAFAVVPYTQKEGGHPTSLEENRAGIRPLFERMFIAVYCID
jgi:hypothetical protein